MPDQETAPHPFDVATSVDARGDELLAEVSPDYWAFVGAFGGTTAATILRALIGRPQRSGDPIALTVNFASPLAQGPFTLGARCLRDNRSTQHWQVELHQPGDPDPRVSASAVFGARRPSWDHQPASPPCLPDRRQLAAYDAGSTAPWVGRYAFHFGQGAPVLGPEPRATPGSAYSEVWISDRPPRPLDVLSLTAMADAFFGRIFQVRGQITPFGTVSLTIYFHATPDELAAQPEDAVIGRADARRFHRSYADQTGELWSAAGRLLATTHQIAYFKA